MCDDERRRGAGLAHELLDDVGLPRERVDVLARLFREAESEEVRRQRGTVPLELPRRPVVRARREAVEQEQQRALAVPAADE